MKNTLERESGMVRLLTARTRIALVAVAMVVSIPAITFAQTTDSTIESEPAAGDTEDDTSVGTDPPVRSTIPTEVHVEIQRHINELRREQMDDRATYFDRLLAIVAIVITTAGYFGFKRFRRIEAEARKSVADAKQHETAAKDIRKRIEVLLGESEERVQLIRNLTAEATATEPDTKRAVKDVLENPKASLIDKAIANALDLQQQGKRDDAIEKWQSIAHVAEGSNNDLAARAWFSVGYLILAESPNDAIADYDAAILLKPDYAGAYNNRGAAKATLGRHTDAIADYDEVIRLRPDDGNAYSSRGALKAALGRHTDAIADHNEAIRLRPDDGNVYSNRGYTKAAAGLKDEARKDFKIALELARNANDATLAAQVEKSLRDLDDAGGS